MLTDTGITGSPVLQSPETGASSIYPSKSGFALLLWPTMPSCVPQYMRADAEIQHHCHCGGRKQGGKRDVELCTHVPKFPQAPSGWDSLLQMECLYKHITWQDSLLIGGFNLDNTSILLVGGETENQAHMWDLVCTEKLHWLLRVTIFQVSDNREFNFVEIKNSWPFLLTIFLCIYDLQNLFCNFHRAQRTAIQCILQRKTNMKMVNLKITSNHRKCKFSDNETANSHWITLHCNKL